MALDTVVVLGEALEKHTFLPMDEALKLFHCFVTMERPLGREKKMVAVVTTIIGTTKKEQMSRTGTQKKDVNSATNIHIGDVTTIMNMAKKTTGMLMIVAISPVRPTAVSPFWM